MQKRMVIGYRVELPFRMDGPIENPASSEVLRVSDGWTLTSARRFAKLNGGVLAAKVVKAS